MSFTKKVVAGQNIAAADFAKFFGDHFSELVKTGFEVTEGTGLVVDISAGTAYVKDASGYMYQIVSDATETITLADDSTNYVFLHSNNGATYITDSTSATVPDDAILLATVVTASGDVSTVTDGRTTTNMLTYDFYTYPGTFFSNASLFGGQNSTTTKYLYFNPGGKIVTISKIKGTLNRVYPGKGAVAKFYYNVGGGEVLVWTKTDDYTIDDDDGIVSNPGYDAYLKFEFKSGTTVSDYTTVWTLSDFRFSYSIE